MLIVGVDYSMTCPCLCFMDTSWTPDFKRAGFMYLSTKKNEQKEWNVGAALMVGKPIPSYESEQERFTNIASQLLTPLIVAMKNGESVKFYIEGYAMGAKGRVFAIAEHAGMLKYFCWLNKVPFEVVPPSVIKKFATGKGNADKAVMHDAFVQETGVSLIERMFPDRKLSSPITDIVDSYYLTKYGVSRNRLVDLTPPTSGVGEGV